jgi:hypothetical protein
MAIGNITAHGCVRPNLFKPPLKGYEIAFVGLALLISSMDTHQKRTGSSLPDYSNIRDLSILCLTSPQDRQGVQKTVSPSSPVWQHTPNCPPPSFFFLERVYKIPLLLVSSSCSSFVILTACFPIGILFRMGVLLFRIAEMCRGICRLVTARPYAREAAYGPAFVLCSPGGSRLSLTGR